MKSLDKIIAESVRKSVKKVLKENDNSLAAQQVLFKIYEIIDKQYGSFSAEQWDELAKLCQRRAQIERMKTEI